MKHKMYKVVNNFVSWNIKQKFKKILLVTKAFKNNIPIIYYYYLIYNRKMPAKGTVVPHYRGIQRMYNIR